MRTTARPRPPKRTTAWAPLLVLGLWVSASVVLISTCMAMIGTEAETSPHAGVATVPAPAR